MYKNLLITQKYYFDLRLHLNRTKNYKMEKNAKWQKIGHLLCIDTKRSTRAIKTNDS